MADSCDVYTVAGLTINDPNPANNTLILDDNPDGLDGADLRRTIAPRGQAAGSILLPAQEAHRIVTFKGFVAINTVEWNEGGATAYRAAQETLAQAWIAAIAGITNTPGTLAWLTHSLAVYKNSGPKFSANGQAGPFGMKFILSLYAPDPTIA
jgi:hypothetical protein